MKRFIVLLLLFFVSITSWATLNEVDRGVLSSRNVLTNPGFENGKSHWTASAGSFAVVTSGSNLLLGNASVTWDAAASADTLSSSSYTIANGLFGRNGVAYCTIMTPSGTATHSLQVYDGSNAIGSTTVTSSTSPVRTTVNFVFPTSGTVALRLYANANEPSVTIDECYMGLADGVNLISGELTTAWTTYTPTFTGFGTVSTQTSRYRRVGPNLEIQTRFVAGTTTATEARVSFPGSYTSISTIGTTEVAGSCTYGSAIGTTILPLREASVGYFTFGDQAATGGSTAKVLGNARFSSGQVISCNVTVPIAGWETSSVSQVPSSLANSWSGYHDATCSWARTNTSYGDPTADASCALVERTNRNFGTVSTSGSVLPAITFTPPRAGTYYVCARTAYFGSAATPNMGFRIWDGTTVIAETEDFEQSASLPRSVHLCGIYRAAGGAAVTLSVQTKASSGSITLTATAAAAALEWNIFQIDQSMPAPVIANSVTSPSAGVLKTATAYITNSGTPTITRQDGSWISSLTDNGTGDTTVNITSGTFSSTPNCICTAVDSSFPRACSLDTTTALSSTAIRLNTSTTSSNALFDCDFVIQCTGTP